MLLRLQQWPGNDDPKHRFRSGPEKIGARQRRSRPAGLASRPGNVGPTIHLFALAPPLPLAPRARLPRHALPHVETSPPQPSSPEKEAPLPERCNVAGVGLALSTAAKGDGLVPGRSARVRLEPGHSAAAPQLLRRGPTSSADHSFSCRRRRRTNSSRRRPPSLALPQHRLHSSTIRLQHERRRSRGNS
jgi:hypothetical protein